MLHQPWILPPQQILDQMCVTSLVEEVRPDGEDSSDVGARRTSRNLLENTRSRDFLEVCLSGVVVIMVLLGLLTLWFTVGVWRKDRMSAISQVSLFMWRN